MFGKRKQHFGGNDGPLKLQESPPPKPKKTDDDSTSQAGTDVSSRADEEDDGYYALKSQVMSTLLETIDIVKLSDMDAAEARGEIQELINDIAKAQKLKISLSAQENLYRDICNAMLG